MLSPSVAVFRLVMAQELWAKQNMHQDWKQGDELDVEENIWCRWAGFQSAN